MIVILNDALNSRLCIYVNFFIEIKYSSSNKEQKPKK
jgi:hypothetical protein